MVAFRVSGRDTEHITVVSWNGSSGSVYVMLYRPCASGAADCRVTGTLPLTSTVRAPSHVRLGSTLGYTPGDAAPKAW